MVSLNGSWELTANYRTFQLMSATDTSIEQPNSHRNGYKTNTALWLACNCFIVKLCFKSLYCFLLAALFCPSQHCKFRRYPLLSSYHKFTCIIIPANNCIVLNEAQRSLGLIPAVVKNIIWISDGHSSHVRY